MSTFFHHCFLPILLRRDITIAFFRTRMKDRILFRHNSSKICEKCQGKIPHILLKSSISVTLLLAVVGLDCLFRVGLITSSGGDEFGIEFSYLPPHAIRLEQSSKNNNEDGNSVESTLQNSKAASHSSSQSFFLRQNFISYLRTLEAFPKKLHILFPHKNYYRDKDPPLHFVKHSILRFIDLNPTWNVTVYDDGDMDEIIARACRDAIISEEEKNILIGNETAPAAHRKLSILTFHFFLSVLKK